MGAKRVEQRDGTEGRFIPGRWLKVFRAWMERRCIFVSLPGELAETVAPGPLLMKQTCQAADILATNQGADYRLPKLKAVIVSYPLTDLNSAYACARIGFDTLFASDAELRDAVKMLRDSDCATDVPFQPADGT